MLMPSCCCLLTYRGRHRGVCLHTIWRVVWTRGRVLFWWSSYLLHMSPRFLLKLNSSSLTPCGTLVPSFRPLQNIKCFSSPSHERIFTFLPTFMVCLFYTTPSHQSKYPENTIFIMCTVMKNQYIFQVTSCLITAFGKFPEIVHCGPIVPV